MTINKQVSTLEKKINDLKEKLRIIRDNCSHEGHERIPLCNTGNYDPNDDSYWYNCKCHICGKIWREDQ
jgi:hypothetical protein